MLIPYKVDVPMDRWPISNFVLIGITCLTYLGQHFVDETTLELFVLNGWNPLGLFGNVFLHADIFHLSGNMLFLWVFGNAICAKLGNGKYLAVYFGLEFISSLVHLMFDGRPAIGASGAINGIIGLFFVLYPLNVVSMLFIFFYRYYAFTLSSIYLILIWFAFDLLGALSGGGVVAYFSHLGGFAGGVALGWWFLIKDIVQPSETELTLLQFIENKGRLNKYELPSSMNDVLTENHPSKWIK